MKGVQHLNVDTTSTSRNQWIIFVIFSFAVVFLATLLNILYVGPAFLQTSVFGSSLFTGGSHKLQRNYIFSGTVAHIYNLNSTRYRSMISHAETHESTCKSNSDKVWDLTMGREVCTSEDGAGHCYLQRPALFQHIGVAPRKILRVDVLPGEGLGPNDDPDCPNVKNGDD